MPQPKLPLCLFGIVFFAFLTFSTCRDNVSPYPAPTGGISLLEDKENSRLRWLESMHRTATGTNWRQLEYQNRLRDLPRRAALASGRSDCDQVLDFPGPDLKGRWIERGSNNQAGSIVETAYDPVQDRIWLISAGGTIWSSPREEVEWRIENQELQFDAGFLQFTEGSTNNRRLLAFSGQMPHYSDDEGKHWHRALGVQANGPNPAFHSPVLLSDQSFFVLSKSDYYHAFEVFRSSNRGSSFQKIMSLDSYERSFFSLCQPHDTDLLLLARKTPEQKLRLQQWNEGQQLFVDIPAAPPLDLGRAPANLIGGLDSLGQLRLLTYTEKDGVYFLHKSTDKGQSWEDVGQLPAVPWEVGIFLSRSDPKVLYLGEIEAFRSKDAGVSWKKINDWWEYYDNIGGALHADIMDFNEYRTRSGETFTLIGHHGGVSISYDQFTTQQNLGLVDLNTSQYYSVRTDPRDPNFVYAGSQDQGLQRAVAFNDQPAQTHPFEQVLSGDYGPIVFTRQGTALWTVYPEGWVNYYDNPQSGNLTSSFELNSEDESVWLPPLMPDPIGEKNAVYLAGGNLQGGPGSYLIRLEYRNKKMESSQLNYNFKLESGGGVLSALAYAPSDPTHWYTSTTNGRFFYSYDEGKKWEQSLNFVPEGHYLYGQAILVSASNPKQLWLAGSGYNNPPVYQSQDGGKSFQAMDQGLPATLVFALAANEDESLIFAATEAGPFVYQRANNRWYDLGTHCTPAQTYWSVEYVAAIRTVRFGTYGRGIWDLVLDQSTPTNEPAISNQQLHIYPNPTSGPLNIFLDTEVPLSRISIHDASGRLVQEVNQEMAPTVPLQLDMQDLPKGIYILKLESPAGVISRKIVRQ